MKIKNIFTRSLLTLAVAGSFLTIGLANQVSAAIEYDPNSSISTPVFNTFLNVPNRVGNEPDFVRIRQNLSGDNKDNQNNPEYQDSLSKACKAGDKFDVRAYIHNGAANGFNDNGSGSGVAHDVKLNLSAPLGKTDDSFTFSATVSASNATSVQDTAKLNCTKEFKLSLVPKTVNIYSQQYNWNNLPDSTVNSTTKLGSPVLGSGDVFGCWEYRIVVVYTVKLAEKPVVPPVEPPKEAPKQPKELIKTGPGSMLGAFAGSSLAGAFLHRRWTTRKNK